MSETPQRPDGTGGAHVWARLTTSSLFLRANVVAILVAGAGLLLPRVTAGGFGLMTERTGYGQVFGLLLLVVGAMLAWRYLARTDRLTGALLFVAWLGLLALAGFETVRVSAALGDRYGLAGVGIGLYCNVAGAAMGTLAALVDAMGQWTADAGADGMAGNARTPPWAWLAATGTIVLTLAAVGATGQLAGRGDLVRSAAAGGFGPHARFSIGAQESRPSDQSPVEGRHPATPSGTATTSGGAIGSNLTLGTTGATGATGVTGDSGNSGSWGMGIGLADYWPGYTGAPGSFYIWPGYLGPDTNTGETGGSGLTVTGASGLTGSGTGSGTGTGAGVVTTSTTTTTTPPPTPPTSPPPTTPPPPPPPPPPPAGNNGTSSTTVPTTTSPATSGRPGNGHH